MGFVKGCTPEGFDCEAHRKKNEVLQKRVAENSKKKNRVF